MGGAGGRQDKASVGSRGSSVHVGQLVSSKCLLSYVIFISWFKQLSLLLSNFCSSSDSEISQTDEMTDEDVMGTELHWPDINWLWHKVQEWVHGVTFSSPHPR